ncbi:MAG TPA: hypothetical protein VMB53_11050 [Gaiellaceae bacterium]|nr:hypothetical protein [Gaiellaceae bacterium]
MIANVAVAIVQSWGDSACTPDSGCGPPNWWWAIFTSMFAFDGVAALIVASSGGLSRRRPDAVTDV